MGPAQSNPTSNLTALIAAAGLAGLFTDRVMQQMAKLVGASPPGKLASGEATVGIAGDERTAEDESEHIEAGQVGRGGKQAKSAAAV